MSALTIAQDPAGPTGDLGDLVGTKMRDKGIERAGNGGHGAQLLDKIVAGPLRSGGMNRIAGRIRHRLGAGLPGRILEYLHLPGRKGGLHIVNHELARAELDIEMGALLCRQAGQMPVEHGLGGGHQLHHRLSAACHIGLDRFD